MSNPYQVPATEQTVRTSPWRARTHKAVAILIALFCALQFLAVWLLVLDTVKTVGFANAPILALAGKVVMPFSLALGGIFMAFGRKLSAVFFAAYRVQYLVAYGTSGRMDLISVALVFAFLAYALWRWKAGELSGWPGRR
ncbi:MAG: hypothetical protein ACREPD_12010 [Stenotrophomonas sp.]|uniref:hypothetical protein n=1 Tax=Stenotrophomonas sp. TaxID=69392 RepID=UPI003D6DA5E6